MVLQIAAISDYQLEKPHVVLWFLSYRGGFLDEFYKCVHGCILENVARRCASAFKVIIPTVVPCVLVVIVRKKVMRGTKRVVYYFWLVSP